MSQLIVNRIKTLRSERQISQEQMAEALGFKDRQTVSAIETGERRISAEELIGVAAVLGAPLQYFTDPFLLAGEGRFSWRQNCVDGASLDRYEKLAGGWIAAYRELAPKAGVHFDVLRTSLKLGKDDSYDAARSAGETFATQYDLGDTPAEGLLRVMQERLGVLVLMVDATAGISGAACRLANLDVVLINRAEVEGRRNFDMAHELFHVLTWDTMPPERLEDSMSTGGSRIEKLANAFASGLLMPSKVVASSHDWKKLDQATLIARLNADAIKLKVSAEALKWRLASLKLLTISAARAVPSDALKNNGLPEDATTRPRPFSQAFVQVMHSALASGRVSARRMATLLGTTVEDVAALFTAYALASPIDI